MSVKRPVILDQIEELFQRIDKIEKFLFQQDEITTCEHSGISFNKKDEFVENMS